MRDIHYQNSRKRNVERAGRIGFPPPFREPVSRNLIYGFDFLYVACFRRAVFIRTIGTGRGCPAPPMAVSEKVPTIPTLRREIWKSCTITYTNVTLNYLHISQQFSNKNIKIFLHAASLSSFHVRTIREFYENKRIR